MRPWTKRLSVDWRRSVAYYEHRLEIVRAVEDRGWLRQFRVEDNEMLVRVGDPHHVLILRPDGLDLRLLREDYDQERVDFVLGVAWDALAPSRLARSRASYQWVIPVNRDYDEARAEAIAALFGREAPRGLTDFAFAADGELASTGTFSSEVGIIQAAEVGPRLARAVGRLEADRTVPAALWPAESSPDVAYFCDISVRSPQSLGEAGLKDVQSRWGNTEDEASELASELLKRIGADL